MRKIGILIMLAVIIFAGCQPKEQEKTCTISGTVINRPESKNLIMIKYFDDLRYDSKDTIPIKDGKFSYTFKYKDVEAYNLIFEEEIRRGSWYSTTFFPAKEVNFELNTSELISNNKIEGGKLNKSYYDMESVLYKKVNDIEKELRQLEKDGKYDSKEMQELYMKFEEAKDDSEKKALRKEMEELYKNGLDVSKEAKELETKIKDEIKKADKDVLNQVRTDVTIPNYFTLCKCIYIYEQQLSESEERQRYKLKPLINIQKIYAKKFKNHPYTERINKLIWTLTNITKGGKFYDFTLDDMNGKTYKLSEMIKGKYALIDIWAPWCGSCLRGAVAMKPVFEEYKDKGFTVVGVASKYKDIKNVTKRLEDNKFPWVTLNDKGGMHSNITIHYGTENAGGKTIFVDDKGVIIAIQPTVEEVKAVLKEKLN